MAALRVGAHQWVHSARRGARIIGRRDALSHIAAAGVSAVVLIFRPAMRSFRRAGSASQRPYIVQNDVLPPVTATSRE